ncbi:hypothetical protein ASE95_08665 [Sphingomonas sp. Leaf231]|uniref:hypothetical protein n=1 Tax=Sphingomonas sp. Leaf231 TaxID=1736301 RepID=UPI0006F973AA|nr:hypothetical protein [Sphingomonas sp. Leaf231]KQN92727.1 hypothetical protein ASE95_08665 [Sphingomonas sp. Leaf231]
MRKTFTAAAIVLAAAPAGGTPAAATPQAVSGAKTPAFPLDVAGVRLGMSASEARAALVKAGYAMPATNGVSYGPSFAARIRAEAARRRTGAASSPAMTDRVMTQLKGVGPNREAITVGLTAAPAGGSTVTSVYLTMPQDGMKGDAFLRQVIAKYGKPDGSRDQGMTLAWCSAPLKSVCGMITPFQRRPEALPNLTASVVYNDNTIRLQDGTEQDRDRERAYAAAVDGAAPKTDRAAF